MEQRFSGKVAIVTGGASGIGLAVVRRFVGEGGSAVVADINHNRLKMVREELGDRVRIIDVDVTQEGDIEAMVDFTIGEFGSFDCAFNVAGSARLAPIHELAVEDWDYTVNVCLKGVFLSVKHEARKWLLQERGGSIVNISSINAVVPAFGFAAYCVSKAGVSMLAKCGTIEWAGQNIRINTVSPGVTSGTNFASDGALSLFCGLSDPKGRLHSAFMERIPMSRAGEPDDQAAAACFLASDDAKYISGADLVVDGGWSTTTYPNLRKVLEQLRADASAK